MLSIFCLSLSGGYPQAVAPGAVSGMVLTPVSTARDPSDQKGVMLRPGEIGLPVTDKMTPEEERQRRHDTATR